MGVAAIVLVWLVFSVLKKVVGLVFLAAVVIGAVYLWNNPAALHAISAQVGQFLSNRS